MKLLALGYFNTFMCGWLAFAAADALFARHWSWAALYFVTGAPNALGAWWSFKARLERNR